MVKKTGNQKWIEKMQKIDNCCDMLEFVTNNATLLNDTYYRELTEPMLEHADKLVQKERVSRCQNN